MKKKKKFMKDFNFKDFMFRKGEKAGLAVSVCLMVLLAVLGIAVKGLGSGSASDNTNKLEGMIKSVKSNMGSSLPPADLVNLPDPLLQPVELSPVERDAYNQGKPYFDASPGVDRKWRIPRVLEPDEFDAQFVHGPVKTYFYSDDFKQIYIVSDAKGSTNTKPSTIDAKTARQLGLTMKQIRRFSNQVSRQNQIINQINPGNIPGSKDLVGNQGEEDSKELQPVPIDKAADLVQKGDKRFAETIYPCRMVVVTGTFPYREQMEEFKKALHYDSLAELQADSEWTFEFLPMKFKRRTLSADGKVTKDWENVDLQSALEKIIIPAVPPSAEREDDEMAQYQVVWKGDTLVMPRPLLARADYKYPEVHLDGLKNSIEILKKKDEEMIKKRMEGQPNEPPPPDRVAMKGVNIYDADELEQAPGADNPNQPQNTQPKKDDRKKGGMPGRSTGGNSPMGKRFNFYEQPMPERCLLRFVDVTVKPGETYEYKVQVRMTNPVFEKKDRAAYVSLAKVKEVDGEWKEIGKRVTVPSETYFYAVDEKTEKKSADKEPNQDRAAVQIQRWLDYASAAQDTRTESKFPVGDWSICEKFLVYRGEFVGGILNVEVPWWNPKEETYELAGKKSSAQGRKKTTSTVPVDFTLPEILVDFEGGKRRYSVAGKAFDEESAEELLLLNPETNKLTVRTSRIDADDKQRKERYAAWRKWVNEVEQGSEAKEGGTKQPGGATPNVFEKGRGGKR